MTIITKNIELFEAHAKQYDSWFERHPFVFKSEVEALREMLPPGESHGIEVGLGTGRFSMALGLKEGIEPSLELSKIASKRGVEVMNAVPEFVPYKDLHFDFVLIASSVSYFEDIEKSFKEANRVLKRGGRLILGFIDQNSKIGKEYENRKEDNVFYEQATFYPVSRIVEELKVAGFKDLAFSQTLFNNLEDITKFEASKPGFGEGSFVVIKAFKH